MQGGVTGNSLASSPKVGGSSPPLAIAFFNKTLDVDHFQDKGLILAPCERSFHSPTHAHLLLISKGGIRVRGLNC